MILVAYLSESWTVTANLRFRSGQAGGKFPGKHARKAQYLDANMEEVKGGTSVVEFSSRGAESWEVWNLGCELTTEMMKLIGID